MPELPEVETVRRRIAPLLEGRALAEVAIADARLTRPLIWVIAANGAGELIELLPENLQKAQQQS